MPITRIVLRKRIVYWALWVAALMLAACTSVQQTQVPPEAALTKITYQRFTLWYDCARGEPWHFQYHLEQDHGQLPRPSSYSLDPSLPAGCKQQHSSSTYNPVHSGFDVGHLVPVNQLDDDREAMREANRMPNLVPQYAGYNRRTWYATELIAECYRDRHPLEVIGGVVYGNSAEEQANDFFLASHGIRTPDALWKVILSRDPLTERPMVIAWYIPHREGLGYDIDPYLVSVRELERRLGPHAPHILVPASLKDSRPTVSWRLPAGCNRN